MDYWLTLDIHVSAMLFLRLVIFASSVSGNTLFFNTHHELRRPDNQQSFTQSPSPATLLDVLPDPTVRTRPTSIYRPNSKDAYKRARLRSLREQQTESLIWDEITVDGPDITHIHTLAQLARMSGNAYSLPGEKNWYDVDSTWNTSFPFGWDNPDDGFRGHVFVSSDGSTVVLSIKGTTLQGQTSKKDKFNDNLLFSCCCARVDFSWIFRQVCKCFSGGWRCDNTCLSNALIEDSLFYSIGVSLVEDLLQLYPNANIWLVGHSLGGSLASLLGSTFGLPSVAFEAPGERLAAERLHLPLPPDFSVPTTHIYHNSDPIPQGACTGVGSPCSQAGYALETRCHLGKSIVFDTVNRLGWRVDVRKHVIKDVITKVLEADVQWDDDNEVPPAVAEEDCIDCFKWEFGDFSEPLL